MTEWFARAVLHVSNTEASLRFYVDRLGFTVSWHVDWEGRTHIAEVGRQVQGGADGVANSLKSTGHSATSIPLVGDAVSKPLLAALLEL